LNPAIKSNQHLPLVAFDFIIKLAAKFVIKRVLRSLTNFKFFDKHSSQKNVCLNSSKCNLF